MSKKGKGNIFFKGMQSDVDPSIQPEGTYRYANNARLISKDGNNVAIKPYDSDRLAIKLPESQWSEVTITPLNSFEFENQDTITQIQDVLSFAENNYIYSFSNSMSSGDVYQSEYVYNPAWQAVGWVDEYYVTSPLFTQEMGSNPEWGPFNFIQLNDFNQVFEDWSQGEIDFSEQVENLANIVFTLEFSTSEGGNYYLDVPLEFEDNLELMAIVTGSNIGIDQYVADYFNSQESIYMVGQDDPIENIFNITVTETIDEGAPAANYVFFNTQNSLNIVESFSVQASGQIYYSISGTNGNSLGESWLSYYMNYLTQTFQINTGTGLIGGPDGLGLFISDAIINAISNEYPNVTYYTNEQMEAIALQEIAIMNDAYEELEITASNIWNLDWLVIAGYLIADVLDSVTENYFVGENGPDNILFDFNQPFIDNQDTVQFPTEDDVDEDFIANGYPTGNITSFGMSILGHYEFSDYLVLLGKWEAMAVSNGYPTDFVIKTKQKKDGTLFGPGEQGYELFYVGNLGFTEKQKVKVTGSEEGENIRRIYFTDGEFPIRTMNVAAGPGVYDFFNSPDNFNLFAKAKFSIPKVTSVEEGGSLDSLAYSFAFRYKTSDGKYSRISPFSNPASLPVTSLSIEASFTKGGAPGTNTGKMLNGIVENLDSNFAAIEMIAISYIGNSINQATIFNTYLIPDGVSDIEWTYNGSEAINELSIEHLQGNYISWDTCRALDVKDNRLFCGNLRGTSIDIPENFVVRSYNSSNETYGGTENPHLYEDLLYSIGGLSPNQDLLGVVVPQSNDDGKYCKPYNTDYYRYIKGPTNTSGEGNGLYNFEARSPVKISSQNISPPLEDEYTGKRGIFGAESAFFRTSMSNGEYEGVRVTFRMIDYSNESPTIPIQIDNATSLFENGSFEGVKPPLYNLDADGVGGYYSSYANPVYNSNYTGYRRGEIYRFGILFYDKKGAPMFVKKIGDIRMPEHSTEYIVPKDAYVGDSITRCTIRWPFYYQTTRASIDGGFADWPNPDNTAVPPFLESDFYSKPYQTDLGKNVASPQGHLGCVLYPHFEVKLSSNTASQVGGYSIVRVPRDQNNKTILTSGVLNRAVSYTSQQETASFFGTVDNWEGANAVGMAGKYGNDPLPIYTPTQQGYDSVRYGQISTTLQNSQWSPSPINMAFTPQDAASSNDEEYNNSQRPIGLSDNWHSSNVYTLDSPEASVSNLLLPGASRLKITESRYSFKQNVVATGYPTATVNNGGGVNLQWQTHMNSHFQDWAAGNSYPLSLPNDDYPDYEMSPFSYNLFGIVVNPSVLEGGLFTMETQNVDGDTVTEEVEIGGWKHGFGPNNSNTTDWNDVRNEWGQGFFPGGFVNMEWEGDLVGAEHNFGIYTKYYSKRIGSYPMYHMARPDWIYRTSSSSANTNGQPYGGYGMDIKLYGNGMTTFGFQSENGPDSGFDIQYPGQDMELYSWIDFDSNNPYYEGVRACNVLPDILRPRLDNAGGEFIANYSLNNWDVQDYWFSNDIQFAKVVNPGEEISTGALNSDRPYKNATIWHDFMSHDRSWSMNNCPEGGWFKYGLGNNVLVPSTNGPYEGSADYSLGNKKILLSLKHQGAMPITRHCLAKDNWQERIFGSFGSFLYNQGSGYSSWKQNQFSPEVTVASIVSSKNAASLYGGNTALSFKSNLFQSTGHFTSVSESDLSDNGTFSKVGINGHHVFGGDTYICNYSVKKTHNPGTDTESNHNVLTAYTCPMESDVNLDLRYGNSLSSSESFIERYLDDDWGTLTYNSVFDIENSVLTFIPKPLDFVERNHWPVTVAFSEPKTAGNFSDNYTIFPVNNIKDLDYTRGPITQMFLLQNDLFALQHSGTCRLGINPRVMIPTGDGGHIATVTGTGNIIERYDYISESYGSQHFHGLALSDRGAYYYDDNSSKFLQLGRGKGGGWIVSSLGDAYGMQSYFYDYNNLDIGDKPLANTQIALTPNQIYYNKRQDWHDGFGQDSNEPIGGISLGYDSQYSEILLTIQPHRKVPKTIVFNEDLTAFTSVISKRGAYYMNFKNRMYTMYDNPLDEGASKLYLSNGYDNMTSQEVKDENSIIEDLEKWNHKFLTFGGVDYYIFDNPDTALLQQSDSISYSEGDVYSAYEYPVYTYDENPPEIFGIQTDIKEYREPFHLQLVFNQESHRPKIFDKMSIMINPETELGSKFLYFRKFAFMGSANITGIHEFDMMGTWNDPSTILEEGPKFNYASTATPLGFWGEGFLDSSASGETSAPPLYSITEDGEELTDFEWTNENSYLQPEPSWYSSKDGIHNVPMRRMNDGDFFINSGLDLSSDAEGTESVARGGYVIASLVMGWSRDGKWFSDDTPTFDIKNENFSIFSIIPHYRYSRR